MIALPEKAMAPALASAMPCRRRDFPSGLFKRVPSLSMKARLSRQPVELVVTRHQQLDFRRDRCKVDLDVDARGLAARKCRVDRRRELLDARDVRALRTKCARHVVIARIAEAR